MTAVALETIFGLTSINNLSVDPSLQHMGGFADFIYGGFVYAWWSFVIGWIILTCTLGMGGKTFDWNIATL